MPWSYSTVYDIESSASLSILALVMSLLNAMFV